MSAFSQSSGSSGTIHGSVQDPSGAVIANATVEVQNPVSQYNQSAHTDAKGMFQLPNLPLNNYHLVVSAKGFQPTVEDVDVRSTVPVSLKIGLTIGAAATTVDVVSNGTDLVETDPQLIPMWIGTVRKTAARKCFVFAEFVW